MGASRRQPPVPRKHAGGVRLARPKSARDGIELDVSLTKDGRVVVMHDNKVDRTTDGHGEICDFTWDEMRKLDCGQGQHPPLLSETCWS